MQFHLSVFLAVLSCAAFSSVAENAAAQSGSYFASPPAPDLAPIDFSPEKVGEVGKWYKCADSCRVHYSLEQLDVAANQWMPLPDGQFYGNGQPLKYFVTDGPLPASGLAGAGSVPGATPAWQLRWLTLEMEMQQGGASTHFRLSRPASVGGPVPLAAWDAVLSDEMPAMPVGTRLFLFQSWEDMVGRIRWNTEFRVTVTAGPPPGDSLPSTPEQAGELNCILQGRAGFQALFLGVGNSVVVLIPRCGDPRSQLGITIPPPSLMARIIVSGCGVPKRNPPHCAPPFCV